MLSLARDSGEIMTFWREFWSFFDKKDRSFMFSTSFYELLRAFYELFELWTQKFSNQRSVGNALYRCCVGWRVLQLLEHSTWTYDSANGIGGFFFPSKLLWQLEYALALRRRYPTSNSSIQRNKREYLLLLQRI